MTSIEEQFLDDISADDGPELRLVDSITPAGEYAAGLRELADLVEAHPELLPWNRINWVSIHRNDDALGALQAAARVMAPCAKKVDDHNFGLSKEFRGGVTLVVETARENVCEKVQVGERVEVELDIDAIKEMAGVTEAELPTISKTVVEYEWKCPPSLLGHNGG